MIKVIILVVLLLLVSLPTY
ncbi:TPA: hypothetical protein ACUL8W_001706 [Haemophilus influenzae]